MNQILIVGAGWVGRQIAARAAQFGYQVWIVDRDPAVCRQAITWMREISAESPDPKVQADLAREPVADWLEHVHIADSLAAFAAGRPPTSDQPVELVIESVPEQLSLKKRVLREISRQFPPPTLIASNSSYFVPSLLSRFVEHPQRFAHLHFHVPVLEDSVIDIVGCEHTQPVVLEQLQRFSQSIDQEPLLLRREHPGYVFNWLLQSVLRSALELAALDVADPRDIDKSWQAVTGMPLGPFGIMDRIGLDVIEQVLSNARWAESPAVDWEQLMGVLAEHTQRGELGVKTQQGFYKY